MRTGPERGNVVFSTDWFDVIEQSVEGWRDPYYMVRSADCVTVLGLTGKGNAVLIRQYRPVLNEQSLEFPSGHVDGEDGSPEEAARRELLEETGYEAGQMELLGTLNPDVGRLQVRLWCYFASGLRRVASPQSGEEKIEVSECTREELLRHAKEGRLLHAQDLAVLLLAILKGRISA